MSDPASREFLFSYRFGGAEWGTSVFAANPAEAKEKVKAMSLARYDGELMARVYVPTFVGRLVAWWRREE